MTEISVFYISLIGIIILLSYKTFIVWKRRCDKQNSIDDHELSADVFCVASDKIYIVATLIAKIIIVPVCIYSKRNVSLVCCGCARFVKNVRLRRGRLGIAARSSLAGGGTASAYLKNILERKKIVQQKSSRIFHSENL